MPGNLQTENIVSDPPPTIVVSLTTTATHFSLSLSLFPSLLVSNFVHLQTEFVELSRNSIALGAAT
jgi:hypothetical protein